MLWLQFRARLGHHPLAAVLLVSVTMRVAVALWMGQTVTALPGIFDQISYDQLGQSWAHGHGLQFSRAWWPHTQAGVETSFWSFGYAVYLGTVYWAVGYSPFAARLLQAVAVGILLPLLAFRLGRRLFDERVALATAALCAVYGYFVYYASALMTEAFYMVAVLWMLDVVIGIAWTRVPIRHGGARSAISLRLHNVRLWLLLGLSVGAAALLRQVILIFVPFMFAWLLLATTRGGSGGPRGFIARQLTTLYGLLLTSTVVVAMILPWTIRNYQLFDRLVPLNTNAGYTFFWSNHPIYGTRFIGDLPSNVYTDLIPPPLRGLDEAALDQALLREGLHFVLEDPLRYVELSLSRIPVFFEFWPSPDSGTASNVFRVLSYGLCLPLIIYGVVVAWLRRSAANDRTQSALLLIVCFAVGYTLIHLASWAGIRYRLPLDAALMPFAGLAVLDLGERITATGLIGKKRMLLVGNAAE